MSTFRSSSHNIRTQIAQCLFGTTLLVLGPAAPASNGLNAIGHSSESLSMGGADLAVARDPSALNSNPAGLTQIHQQRLDFLLATVYGLDVEHRDSLGNEAQSEKKFSTLGANSYARPINERLTWGMGIFAQGGAGYEYQGLRTAFGTTDKLESSFGILKLTVGGAYAMDPKLSLGASMGIIYGNLSQRVFPNTSNLASTFFGFGMDDAHGTAFGAKIGLQFHSRPGETWGLVYTSPSGLTLNSDELVSNQTAAGLGMVHYSDVRVSGLGLPQEIGIAFARQETPRFLWTVELNWLNWAAAMKTSTLTVKQADNPFSPDFTISSANDWRDQYVLAVGTACSLSDRIIWRAGYNYGRNPIPDQNLSPTLATITEHHLTTGIGIELDNHWLSNLGLQYNVPNKITYTNTKLPLGSNAQERYEVLTVFWSISHLW